jgi:GAF domain-containing protein
MFDPYDTSGKSPNFIAFPAVRDELPYRLRQQSLLGPFGRSALQTRDLEQILQRATELCADGLESPFVKVLRYDSATETLVLKALHARLQGQHRSSLTPGLSLSSRPQQIRHFCCQP